MKDITVHALPLAGIQIIRFGKYADSRGYFKEIYRKSDFNRLSSLSHLPATEFVQANQSYSKPGTIRGLHYQWNPYVGKLVRTLIGHMVDIVLDIRKGSPTFGKAVAYDMPTEFSSETSDWIWVPPGFAHGNYFKKETMIEYFCTGEYNPHCEAGISPFAPDIDWSLCDLSLKKEFDTLKNNNPLITEKDKNGFTLESWAADDRSQLFVFK